VVTKNHYLEINHCLAVAPVAYSHKFPSSILNKAMFIPKLDSSPLLDAYLH